MPDSFAIFEGGGAKGLAHIGALKAAEEKGLKFVGVAGASAGAIIATLVAAGFSADELFDPRNPDNSLFGHDKWLEILGASQWQEFKFIKDGAENVLPKSGKLGLRAAARAWSFYKTWSKPLRKAAAEQGFLSTSSFEKWFNQVLNRKLGWAGEPITFKQLRARGAAMPLKLVSVNIGTQKLKIYSDVETPNIPVAKAVAASISIPMFFSPTEVDGHPMVDGGLMSNFPAWLFDYERTLHPTSVRTYGFTLVAPEPPKTRELDPFKSMLKYLSVVVETGIFGGQTLMNEAIELFEVVPIKTTFGVLDFELSPADQAKPSQAKPSQAKPSQAKPSQAKPSQAKPSQAKPSQAKPSQAKPSQAKPSQAKPSQAKPSQAKPSQAKLYQHGYDSAVDYIRTHSVIDDAAVTASLLGLSNQFKALLRRPNLHMRANVMLPVSQKLLRVIYSYNMKDDTDDRLLIPQDQTGAGEAFTQKQFILTDIRKLRSGGVITGLSKYASALVRPDLISLISIPIFGARGEWQRKPAQLRAVPEGVLSFDCDEDILRECDRPDIQEFFIRASIVISERLQGNR